MSRRHYLEKLFYPYVVQISNNTEVLYVNFATDVEMAFKSFLYKHSRIRDSVLRRDLFDEGMYFSSSRRADRWCRRLIGNLERIGYEVIAGGPLHNTYWQVYVIEIDGNPKHLYVGQTNYPVEKRFQQHIYEFNSARALLKHDMFELCMRHARHLPYFRSKGESLEAERQLAEELKRKGYRVEGGH